MFFKSRHRNLRLSKVSLLPVPVAALTGLFPEGLQDTCPDRHHLVRRSFSSSDPRHGRVIRRNQRNTSGKRFEGSDLTSSKEDQTLKTVPFQVLLILVRNFHHIISHFLFLKGWQQLPKHQAVNGKITVPPACRIDSYPQPHLGERLTRFF